MTWLKKAALAAWTFVEHPIAIILGVALAAFALDWLGISGGHAPELPVPESRRVNLQYRDRNQALMIFGGNLDVELRNGEGDPVLYKDGFFAVESATAKIGTMVIVIIRGTKFSEQLTIKVDPLHPEIMFIQSKFVSTEIIVKINNGGG